MHFIYPKKKELSTMSTTCNINQQRPVMYNWLFAFLAAMLLAVTAMMPAPARAATPLAGTNIGNQAAATYTDASAVPRNVTSNTVNTIVQQVPAFTLTAPSTKTVSPGGTVYFPHTLTNTGNGTDTFNLSTANLATNGVTASTFDFSSIQIFADNGSGAPTGPAITTTGALASGAAFKFIVVATAPPGATNAQVDYLNATAVGTATATPAPSQSNLDTANVTGNANISVTKAISAPSGPSPSAAPLTYTLTYTNTGNATATAVTLTDLIPAGMTYVVNSGRWSVTGGTVLTDAVDAAQGTTPATILYDFNTVTPRVTAVINQVPPGNSGTLTFQVNVNSGVAPSVINNTAAYTYNDGVALVPSQNTNTPTYTVNQTAAETFTGATVASAAQGSTVPFTDPLTNTGNGIDSFDITIPAVGTPGNNYPPGTTFQLFKSDGVTPLTDTNGNGIPDTGPVNPGATYNVIVKATLPIGATGGPFSVTLTSTSKFNPAVTATATDTLTVITASSVDITNTTPFNFTTPSPGQGSTGTTVVLTNTTNPGTTTRFVIPVSNTSATADSYNLSTVGLPAGWTVVFRDSTSTGIGTGAIITNTGTINGVSGAFPINGTSVVSSKVVYADVTVPAGQAPGTTPLDFTVLSPISGATDVIRDAVTVNAINNVTLTPNNSGQVFPGGSVVYAHTLTNNGNASQAITFPAGFLTDSQIAAGWTSVLYRDNGTTPGVLDAGDTPVTAAGFPLAAGASQVLLVKVTAPLGAPIGAVDTTTVTATYPTGTAVATDTSTVIGGQVTLTKAQVLDPTCLGTLVAPVYVSTNLTTGATPGTCIRYQITATNVGTSAVTNLVVSDATPANTTYNVGSTPNPAAVTGAGNTITLVPAAGAAGTITATIPTLLPGASAVLTFGVQINP
jgi:uncharacterized repeat protein (TIGR01451 family)